MSAATVSGVASYGLGGLIFVTMVLPLALFIRSMYERSLSFRDAEIARLRSELIDLRRALDPVAPALTEMSRTMSNAITLLERSRP